MVKQQMQDTIYKKSDIKFNQWTLPLNKTTDNCFKVKYQGSFNDFDLANTMIPTRN